jgi:hypothetical protein
MESMTRPSGIRQDKSKAKWREVIGKVADGVLKMKRFTF